MTNELPRRRSPARWVIAALALLAGLVLLGGRWMSRRPGRARTAVDDPAAAPRSDAVAATRLPSPARRLAGAGVPRLGPAPAADREPGPGLWVAATDLAFEQRAELASLGRAARQRAAAALGLTAEELTRIEAVQARSAERDQALEAQGAAEVAEGGSGPIRQLRENAAQELAELTSALGESRAWAFRRLERESYRQLWRRRAAEGTAPRSLESYVQRRMVSLRWPPPPAAVREVRVDDE